ncbi:MAG: hypothetical protein VXZ82_17315 [Planctomycetota bacterium]|nr:hypothetical protein [Planctomycetota bacterium]
MKYANVRRGPLESLLSFSRDLSVGMCESGSDILRVGNRARVVLDSLMFYRIHEWSNA